MAPPRGFYEWVTNFPLPHCVCHFVPVSPKGRKGLNEGLDTGKKGQRDKHICGEIFFLAKPLISLNPIFDLPLERAGDKQGDNCLSPCLSPAISALFRP